MNRVMETDRQLLRHADPAVFGLLFERHGRAVYNYCFRRTADWSVAEDLTSIVFLEAWRKRNEVRIHGDTLLPWLYGVATNILRNRGPVGVFPSAGDETCEQMGLAVLSAEGEAESRRFVRMRDAIYARLGSPASGSSRRSGPCVGEERARAIVFEELARHGYEGWSVNTAGEGFTDDRLCAQVSFDGGSRTAILLAGMR